MKKQVRHQLTLAAFALAAASAAQASPSYGSIGGPGVYFGSGNGSSDINWTIDTANNVQVALRAKNRATLLTIDGSSGVYHAGAGLVGGNKALWNYEFSVNLQSGGGSLTFADVQVIMRVDIDPTANESWVSLDVENNWNDNYWRDATNAGTGGAGCATPNNAYSCSRLPGAGDYGVQQSANPMFGDSGFNFNPSAGLYGLQLEVLSNAGARLALVSTAVQVPEPSGLALVAAALAGLGLVARRRKS